MPEVEKWVSRELEVAGFSEYLLQLASWAAQASLEFSKEITQSARWHGVIYWSMLTSEQRNRSTRLLAILRSAFATHPRTMMLVSAFVEGVHLHKFGVGHEVDDMKGQSANGYELLRQLTLEYSLRTRAEALSLRSLFVNKSYTLSSSETSASSLVSDVIRRIDLEAAKFSRLISTLPTGVDVTGLSLPDADLLVVLLKSLPQEVRSFCLHHASGESYAAYREAARRWEQQQRLFVELPVGSGQQQQRKITNAVFVDEAGTEWYTLEDGSHDTEGHVDAVQGAQQGQGKCQKCGSRKHKTFECATDMSKTRCFRCQGVGHVSMNCPQKNPKDKGKGKDSGKGKSSVVKGDWLKGKGKDKGKSKDKGKGKSKGYGKKGKLNEVSDATDEDWWWYSDSSGWDDSWHDGYTSQVSWTDQEWYESGWGSWDASAGESQEQGHSATPVVGSKGENGVQSLVLSPCFSEECDLCDTGLTLIDPVEEGSNGGSLHVSPQPFLGDLLHVDPQPFGRCESSEKEQGVDKVSNFRQEDSVFDRSRGEDSRVHVSEPSMSSQDVGTSLRCAGEPSGPHNLVNRGCPVFCNCARCSQEAVEFSKQVSFLCGLSGGNMKACSHGSHHTQEHESTCCEGLLSTFSGKVTLLRTSVSTFLEDTHDTVSQMQQLGRFWSQIFPLLSEISAADDDGQWWLLDSGASSTVMASRFVEVYGGKLKPQSDANRFRAANGSAVNMCGETEVVAMVSMFSEEKGSREERKACLKTLVGDIRHNILSTTTLCKLGWEFCQRPDGFHVRDLKSGATMSDVAYFAGCPWVHLRPVKKKVSFSSASAVSSFQQYDPSHDTHVHVSDSVPSDLSPISPLLFPMTKAAEAALQQHRLQGHVPFDRRCIVCQRGKAVFQHRRRKDGQFEAEVQADFGYVTKRGEVSLAESEEGIFKVLILTELSTNAVGYVVIHDDMKWNRVQVVKWMHHFGFTSSSASIVLHTDSERAVSELVGKTHENFVFLVRRARPQQHQSVGLAERGVRRLKEGLPMIRAEMNSGGVDLTMCKEALSDALVYLALTHTHFSRVHGSEFSPLEYGTQRKLSKPQMALFGQTVVAELSTNVRKLSPNETRSVEACFLHPGLDTGPVVQGLVRVENELILKRFVARNIRAVLPPEWNLRFGAKVFSKLEQEIEDVALPDGSGPPQRRLRPLPEVVEEDVSRPPEEDLFEYPDGASGDLVRQMKEPDVPLPKKRSAATGSSQGGLKLARQGPLGGKSVGKSVEVEPSGMPRVDVGGDSTLAPSGVPNRVFSYQPLPCMSEWYGCTRYQT